MTGIAMVGWLRGWASKARIWVNELGGYSVAE